VFSGERTLSRSISGTVLRVEIVNGMMKIWSDPETNEMLKDILRGREPSYNPKNRRSIL
jgi:hypothetical protein